MKQIKVIDVMKHGPYIISPEKTAEDAAKLMKMQDCGVLPVGTHPEKIIGIITDRDLVLRVAAEGKDASKTLVQDVMTRKVITCDGHASIQEAAELMSNHNIHRLIVITKDRAPGIVTFAQLLRNQGNLKFSDDVLHGLLGIQKQHHSHTKTTAG